MEEVGIGCEVGAGGMGGRVEAPFKKSRLSLNNQLNKIN